MMAYTTDTNMSKVTSSRGPINKSGMATSMLQYSERVRVLNTSKFHLTDNFEHGKSEWTHNNNASYITKREKKDTFTGNRRGYRQCEPLGGVLPIVPTKKSLQSTTRRQRPSSFNEKELEQNMKVIKARVRPFSLDEKELERNRKINMQHKARQRREAFTDSGQTIVVPSPGTETTAPSTSGDLRVSLVNASDLYDLVDIQRQSKNTTGINSKSDGTKVMNVVDAIEFVEDIGIPKSKKILPHINHDKHVIPKDLIPKIKSGITGTEIGSSINSYPKNNHSSSYIISETEKTDDENFIPLDVFLQQAVSAHTGQNKLASRPKRAKRMDLRKPRLLDIPEDINSARHSQRTLPSPSDASLQAIKELQELSRLKQKNIPDQALDIDSRYAHHRPLRHELLSSRAEQNSPKKAVYIKNKDSITHRNKQSDIDIDRILCDSIYPQVSVAWIRDNDRGTSNKTHNMSSLPCEGTSSKRQDVLVEKTSQKDKAHKKIKKLVFLRDKPEQHYRRDI